MTELDVEREMLVVRVSEASRAGRSLPGEAVRVNLEDARLQLPDADGDRASSLRDVFPGNRLEVRFTGRDGEGDLRGRALIHLGPQMPVGGLRRLWH